MLRLLSGLLIATCVASAASFPVTVFTDTAATAGGAAAGSGTGAGSPGDLRSQIIAANAFGGAANTITFTCNTPPCTITLNGPLPAITSNLTIDGGTVGNVIIDGNSAYRVFFVDTGTVLLANLQIQNAAAIGGAGGLGVSGAGGGAGFGAGLFINQATASVSLQTVVFRNVAAIGGSGGSGFDDGNLPGFGGAGGGGMGFGGAAGDIGGNSRGGGGGGGIQGTGSAFNGSIGGNGGAGGGGAGASNGAVGSGSGGSAYAGNTAGADGGSHMAGNGGFGGGGGGGDCTGTAGAGGFGGGGGGIGSCFELPGGAGGFGGGGGGGGNLNGGTSATVGGVAGGTGGNGNNTGDGGGGGGGAAAGPAIFVASGSLTILNSTATGTITAAGGAGGAAPGGGTTVGGNGGSNNTPVFNYGGTVNGSNTTGPIAGALGAGLPATHFSVTAPSPVTSYTTNAFIVTALDATEATATGYNGTVHLTSTDPIFANGTGDQVLTAGTAQFNVAMKTAGTQTVTATDTILSNITGISNNITVVAGPATRFFISSTPVSSQAGTAFGFTVTALDLANNTVTNYGGTVHFTSTDGAAVLPPNSILVNGVGSFNATLNTAGSQTITATDALNPITGSSGSINVLLAAPTISMGFSPTTVQVGGTSSTQLSFSMSNPNSTAITGISFSNTFPAGLVLDSLVAYTCGGAGATLNGTGWSISGVTLAANTSCGGSIRMHATSLGTITDTSGTVTSTNAPASGTAMATLTVNPDVPTLAEAFGAGSITQGNTTSLTFTLVNPNTTTAVSSVNFIDTLPAGLVVATPSGLTTSCGGAATAVSGTTAISLSNVTIAASASCTFTVNVLANATGRFTNTTGAIGSNEGTGLPASATLSVSAAPLTAQTITFAPLPVHTYGDGPVTFTATASSGLPVTFFVWSGPCASINGSFTTVRLTGAGTCVVAANEAGGSGYDAASTVFRNLTINPAPLTVTANNAAMAAGGPLPAFSASFAGFVNGDTSAVVGGSAAFATEATVKSPPGTYPISVSAGTMMAANYTFRFVPGTLTVMGTAVTGLANSASLTAGAIAPNALLTLFNPPASCMNASMSIDGSTAQVLYAGPTQINFMTAGMVANETAATLQVLCGGQIAETVQAPVAAVNPGIFTQTGTGVGQASVVNQDGTINGAATPAQRGTYIALYGTGFGSYNPVGADGLQHTANTVTATVGGVPTSVAYAGYAPTEVTGLQQINIQVPASAAPGASVPVVLTVNGISTTTGVTIAVQ